MVVDQGLQTRRIVRQVVDHRRSLIGDHRHDQDGEHDQRDCKAEDHHEGGHRAIDAKPFDAVRNRIEQIGQRHARDERQQNAMQQPDQCDADQQRRDPEQNLPLQCHRHPLPNNIVLAAGRRDAHVGHPVTQIEADRQQRQ